MNRYFCDLCRNEVESTDAQPEFKAFVTHEHGGETVGLRLLRSIGGTWNKGHLCNACLASALADVVKQLIPPTQETPR